jgi:thiol:disulfide interchange protein
LLLALASRLLALDTSVLAYAVVAGAVVSAVLLLVPATGDPLRGGALRAAPSGRLLMCVVAAGWSGLVGAAWWGSAAERGVLAATPADERALPRAAIARHPAGPGTSPTAGTAAPSAIEWTDWAAGLARARAEGRPVLVTFFTTWCPYCKKMDRETWAAPQVIARVAPLIAVRVDAEQERGPGGISGSDLAARYQVQGFPSQFLLDAEGRVLARGTR